MAWERARAGTHRGGRAPQPHHGVSVAPLHGLVAARARGDDRDLNLPPGEGLGQRLHLDPLPGEHGAETLDDHGDAQRVSHRPAGPRGHSSL